MPAILAQTDAIVLNGTVDDSKLTKAESQKNILDSCDEKKAEREIKKTEEAEKKEKLELANSRKPEIDESVRKAHEIAASEPEYDELDALSVKGEDDVKALSEADEQIAELTEKTDELSKELIKLKDEQKSLDKAGENYAKLENEIKTLRKRTQEILELRDELIKLEELRESHEAAKKDYAEEAEKAEKLSEEATALRRAFNDNQAGILASTLDEGEPCPVCGSVHHPHKAELSTKAPTQSKVEKAEKDAKKAQDAANAASVKAAEKRTSLEAAEEMVMKKRFELLDDMELEDALADVNGKLETACSQQEIEEKNKDRIIELDELIPNSEEEFKAANEKLADIRNDKTRVETELKSVEERLGALKKKLPFASKAEAAAAREQLEEKAKELTDAIEEAQDELKKSQNELSAVLGAIETFEEQISKFEDLDADALGEKKSELDKEKAEIDGEKTETGARITINEAEYGKLLAVDEEIDKTEHKLRWVETLSKTANGDLSGKDKITLETYIQSTYFNRIIRRANMHFAKMSGGQYELRRRETDNDGRKQTGLELDVLDHYNGTVRNANSLSGGESFIASLSLALGLSDEIQSTAGGIKLDSMFIDEGFGTLDDKTLDDAMRALNELSDGDRLIGIISHVSELRNEIDIELKSFLHSSMHCYHSITVRQVYIRKSRTTTR